MLTIVSVSFFVCTVLAILSAAWFVSTLLSILRRHWAGQPRSSFEEYGAALAIFSLVVNLTIVGITIVELWPTSPFSWAFLVLVNVLLQPIFLFAVKSGLFNVWMAFRGRVAYAGAVVPELTNLPPRERRGWLWHRAISGIVGTALIAGWSFACLSPFF
jgi:hypothetical protein